MYIMHLCESMSTPQAHRDIALSISGKGFEPLKPHNSWISQRPIVFFDILDPFGPCDGKPGPP